MLRTALLAVMIAALLAGCSGSQDTDDPAATDEGAGSGATAGAILAPLTAQSSVPAPTWQVGQWWEWEASFGTTVIEGTFCTIVTAVGSSYTVATENEAMAKEAAAFGTPLLSPIGKADLSMQGWSETPWTLLAFPLTDGKTWSATMPNIAWDIVDGETVSLAMAAAFDDTIGEAGGFRITGKLDAATLVEADYDPASGWFAGLRFFDVDAGEDGLEIGYRAKSTGLDYIGPVFAHTARPLVLFEDLAGFDDFPLEGGQPITTAPQPYWTFTLQPDTRLYGFLVANSVAGGRTVVLVDPANNQRNLVSHGDVDEDEQVLFIDEPGQPGEWKLLTTGAGGFSGAFVALYELTESSSTM